MSSGVTLDTSLRSIYDATCSLNSAVSRTLSTVGAYDVPYTRYVAIWGAAVPLKCVVIGQAPYDHAVFPSIASAFAFEGDVIPPSVRVIAHDISVNTGAHVGDVVSALKKGYLLITQGVLLVNERVHATDDIGGMKEGILQIDAICSVCVTSQRIHNDINGDVPYKLDIITLGRAGERMGKLLKQTLGGLNVSSSVLSSLHPAHYARKWGDAPYASNMTMENRKLSETLAKHLKVPNSVESTHLIDTMAFNRNARGDAEAVQNRELATIVDNYVNSITTMVHGRKDEWNDIQASLNNSVANVPDPVVAAAMSEVVTQICRSGRFMATIASDMDTISAQMQLRLNTLSGTVVSRAAVTQTGTAPTYGANMTPSTSQSSGMSSPAPRVGQVARVKAASRIVSASAPVVAAPAASNTSIDDTTPPSTPHSVATPAPLPTSTPTASPVVTPTASTNARRKVMPRTSATGTAAPPMTGAISTSSMGSLASSIDKLRLTTSVSGVTLPPSPAVSNTSVNVGKVAAPVVTARVTRKKAVKCTSSVVSAPGSVSAVPDVPPPVPSLPVNTNAPPSIMSHLDTSRRGVTATPRIKRVEALTTEQRAQYDDDSIWCVH